MSDQLLTVLKFALMALLYLFFLRVVRAVWAELKEPAPAAPSIPAPMPAAAMAAPPTIVHRSPVGAPTGGPPATDLQLVVVDPPEARGRTFPLGPEAPAEVTVGRAAGCALAFPEDTFVSQLHARLFRADGAWQVEDLGSTNGTLLNGHKVSAPQGVRAGDRIQVGRTVLEVSR